jgi:hypothetical protein
MPQLMACRAATFGRSWRLRVIDPPPAARRAAAAGGDRGRSRDLDVESTAVAARPVIRSLLKLTGGQAPANLVEVVVAML